MKNQSKQLHDFVNTWSTHGNEVTDKVHYWDSLLHICYIGGFYREI